MRPELIDNFARLHPDGNAVWLQDTDGTIMIIGTHQAFGRLPPEIEPVQDPNILRLFLNLNADTSQEIQQFVRFHEKVFSHGNGLASKLNTYIDDIVGVLDIRVVAYRFVDERASVASVNIDAAPKIEVAERSPGRGRDVAAMSMSDRIYEAIMRAPSHLDDAVATEFRKLLVPSTIAIMIGSIVAMIAIASTGIGTGIILAVGWACVGWAIFEAAGHFYDFFNALGDAETDAELDKAAGMLARGITALGVGALINFLTRGAARASTAGGKAVQQAVGNANKAKGQQVKKTAGHQRNSTPEPPAKPTRWKSLRERYLGKNPGKRSRTGREVIERMRKEGKIRDNDADGTTEFKASNGKWYDISKADMAHKTDAVTWWNRTGRQYGAKAREVRRWMLDSNNYYLELNSINRSQGAILGKTQRYLPPLN